MAKDLPYFKFIISEWNDGDITLCSMEAQGLFINLCSLYWSAEGKLSLSKSKRRFSDCNATAWKELISERIIKISDDDIVINFLDEQFLERNETSKKNAENASNGWKKRKNNGVAMRSQSDPITLASNREERREEKKREEIERELFSDELFMEGLNRSFKGKDFRKAFSECFTHHSVLPNPPRETWEWKQKLNTWLTRFKDEKAKTNYKVQ